MTCGCNKKNLIQSDQDAPLVVCPGENLHISRIFIPMARPHDLMPCRTENFNRTTPDTGVEENLQVPVSIRGGSNLSWATKR